MLSTLRLNSVLLGVSILCWSALSAAATEIGDGQYVIFYHNDMLGSPTAATDHNGNVLWHEHNDPFGRNRVRVSSTNNEFGADHAGSRKGYTGHLQDDGADLFYMKARYYDPVIGRFYSNDPVGFLESNLGSFNRYSYVSNNPYRYTDPTGESLWGGTKEFVSQLGSALNGEGFDGSAVGEALAEGYNGEDGIGGFGDALLEDIGFLGTITGVGAATAVGSKLAAAAANSALKKYGTKKIVPKGGGCNLPFADKDRVTGINKTLDRIDGNGPFPHKRDGIQFKNREGRLPEGNYKEYTVDTPGASNRGARRIVRDQNTGNTFYTDDHYKNFTQIDPKKY